MYWYLNFHQMSGHVVEVSAITFEYVTDEFVQSVPVLYRDTDT